MLNYIDGLVSSIPWAQLLRKNPKKPTLQSSIQVTNFSKSLMGGQAPGKSGSCPWWNVVNVGRCRGISQRSKTTWPWKSNSKNSQNPQHLKNFLSLAGKLKVWSIKDGPTWLILQFKFADPSSSLARTHRHREPRSYLSIILWDLE